MITRSQGKFKNFPHKSAAINRKIIELDGLIKITITGFWIESLRNYQ